MQEARLAKKANFDRLREQTIMQLEDTTRRVNALSPKSVVHREELLRISECLSVLDSKFTHVEGTHYAQDVRAAFLSMSAKLQEQVRGAVEESERNINVANKNLSSLMDALKQGARASELTAYVAADGAVHNRGEQIVRNAIRSSLMVQARDMIAIIDKYVAAGEQPVDAFLSKKLLILAIMCSYLDVHGELASEVVELRKDIVDTAEAQHHKLLEATASFFKEHDEYLWEQFGPIKD